MQSDSNKYLIEAFNLGYRINNEGKIINPEGIEIKGYIRPDKYYKYQSFNLAHGRKRIFTHRLMAYQKFGNKIFEDGLVIRHLDGDSTNNSYENITIGTQQENMLDIPKEIRVRSAIKATKKITKYNVSQKEIIEYYNKVGSYKKTMEHFNISSKGTLYYILKNQYKN